MKNKEGKKILFIGIGGIGMSALARYYNHQGYTVYGYDKTPSPLTEALQKEGISVCFSEEKACIEPNTDMAVYTPAIAETNGFMVAARKAGIPLFKRSAILGQLSKQYKCIAIAGTHGKTSITGLLAHIMHTNNIPVVAFVGGIMTNYNSNLIYHDAPKYILVEADEYDRSFHTLHPDISLITAIAPDHLDIYGSFKELVNAFNAFAGLTAPNGKVIVHQDLLNICCADKSYGQHSGSSYFSRNISIKDGKYHFTLHGRDVQINTFTNVPGVHNVENCVAALAVCRNIGLSANQIKTGIESYKGIKRRFEIIYADNETIYIDDYAHHPDELNMCINTAKELYPDKKITGIFQPHLFSRTAELAEGFATSLSKLDKCYLLDIYPAREAPMEGVSSDMILKKMKNTEVIMTSKEDILAHLSGETHEVLITMGAGDIDRLVPKIKTMLKG